MSGRPRNPYMNRVMIRDPADFIGRTQEVEKIFSRLGSSRPQSVSIVGDRRIGKSSLLYHVSLPQVRARYLDDAARFAFVMVDLHGLGAIRVEEFFDLLLEEISAASGVAAPARTASGYGTLKRYLPELERAGVKLVLLWDEFDAITRNENFREEFFSFFRSLANRYDVAYVTTAARELQELCHTEAIAVSPFFNIFTNLYLRAFSAEEARQLICVPSERAGAGLGAHEHFLLDIAGYFPFFLQLACSALFEQIARGAGVEKAQDAARAQFAEEAEPHLRYLSQHLDNESREVLRAVAKGLSLAERQAYIEERLRRDGYLVAGRDRPRVFSSVLASMLRTLEQTWTLSVASQPAGLGGVAAVSPRQRFTFLRDLGSGGMSTVRLAHDNLLDQRVAIKVLDRDLYSKPQMLLRFRRETALARELHHPNICPVFDLIEAEGACYIAMKYIDGLTLSHRIRDTGPMPLPQFVHVGSQILRGLAAAHRVLVHRDLKPQNIILDSRDHVYLLDFGLARTPSDPNVTLSGTLMGTPGYIAPEQIEGREATRRSDLYAVGVILFEMAAGRPPFVADDIDGLLKKHHREEPPDLGPLRPDLPPPVVGLVSSLMAKRPEERPESADAALEALAG